MVSSPEGQYQLTTKNDQVSPVQSVSPIFVTVDFVHQLVVDLAELLSHPQHLLSRSLQLLTVVLQTRVSLLYHSPQLRQIVFLALLYHLFYHFVRVFFLHRLCIPVKLPLQNSCLLNLAFAHSVVLKMVFFV